MGPQSRSERQRIETARAALEKYQIRADDIYNNDQERPRLFLLDGMNGAGKNTTYQLVRQNLRDRGYAEPVLFRPSREGGSIVEARRDYKNRPKRDERTLLALINAERREALLERLPTTKGTSAVFLMRSVASTLAYQRLMGRDAPQVIRDIKGYYTLGDYIFILECAAEVAYGRILAREKEVGTKHTVDELAKQREAFREIDQYFPATRAKRIDTTSKSPQQVAELVLANVLSLLPPVRIRPDDSGGMPPITEEFEEEDPTATAGELERIVIKNRSSDAE